MNYYLPKLSFFTDPYCAGVSNKHCLLINQSLYIDAPVIDHRKDINSYIKHQSDTDHEHDGVSLSSDADKSHDMNGEMAGEESRSINGKGTIKTKKRCVLLDSDDRTTGEIWASSRENLSSGFLTILKPACSATETS